MFNLFRIYREHAAALAVFDTSPEFTKRTSLPTKVQAALTRLQSAREGQIKQLNRIDALTNELASAREEAASLRAELATWKPARDAKGHFIKAEAA